MACPRQYAEHPQGGWRTRGARGPEVRRGPQRSASAVVDPEQDGDAESGEDHESDRGRDRGRDAPVSHVGVSVVDVDEEDASEDQPQDADRCEPAASAY